MCTLMYQWRTTAKAQRLICAYIKIIEGISEFYHIKNLSKSRFIFSIEIELVADY